MPNGGRRVLRGCMCLDVHAHTGWRTWQMHEACVYVCVCVCLCVCVYKLPVFFSQLCSYTDLWFCVWGVNSRVPVLSLKITLGLKFLAPFSSLLTGTLLTSLYACFSFPFLLFWNSLYPWSLFFLFFFLSVILNPSVATEKCLKLPRDR